MLAMVGLVAVVLVIAGAGSLDPHPQRGAQPGAAAAGLRGQLADVVQDRARSRSTCWRPSARRSSSRTPTSFRSTASATWSRRCPRASRRRTSTWPRLQSGQTTLGPQGQPRLRGGAGHALRRRSSPELRTPARRVRGHVRRPPDPRRRRPRAELGVLHRCRGSGAARGRPGGLADVAPDGPPARRGHGGDRPHRVGRAGQPRPRPARRLPRVRLAGRLHQRHGPEPGGRPRPGAPAPPGGLARPAHPAHVHPWLRRGDSGRGDRGQRPGGRRDHRRVAAAGAPRRRPARSHQARGAPDVDRHCARPTSPRWSPRPQRGSGPPRPRAGWPLCCRCPARTGCPRRHPRSRWWPTPIGWPSCWPTSSRTP